MSRDIPSLLQSLVTGVFEISRELGAIRTAIEEDRVYHQGKKDFGQ